MIVTEAYEQRYKRDAAGQITTFCRYLTTLLRYAAKRNGSRVNWQQEARCCVQLGTGKGERERGWAVMDGVCTVRALR